MYTDTSKCDMAGEIGISELGSRVNKLAPWWKLWI